MSGSGTAGPMGPGRRVRKGRGPGEGPAQQVRWGQDSGSGGEGDLERGRDSRSWRGGPREGPGQWVWGAGAARGASDDGSLGRGRCAEGAGTAGRAGKRVQGCSKSSSVGVCSQPSFLRVACEAWDSLSPRDSMTDSGTGIM